MCSSSQACPVLEEAAALARPLWAWGDWAPLPREDCRVETPLAGVKIAGWPDSTSSDKIDHHEPHEPRTMNQKPPTQTIRTRSKSEKNWMEPSTSHTLPRSTFDTGRQTATRGGQGLQGDCCHQSSSNPPDGPWVRPTTQHSTAQHTAASASVLVRRAWKQPEGSHLG